MGWLFPQPFKEKRLADNSQRGLENQWHKIFLGWQGILGQLKVEQKKLEGKSFFGSLFGKKG